MYLFSFDTMGKIKQSRVEGNLQPYAFESVHIRDGLMRERNRYNYESRKQDTGVKNY